MRWNYSENYRELFAKGVHRDILIVPHATDVDPNPSGGPPIITYKVPDYYWDNNDKFWKPRKSGNEVIYQDVPWIIDNNVIVKEKFKYSYSLNSDDNITFSACNAAMIQFTIRNNKEYVQDEVTHQFYWKEEIPNLQNIEITMVDPNYPEASTKKIVGEIQANACIKLYMYFNNDSRTLMYMGMFQVEEDKVVDNGYSRQITAYDFMAFFRDCDIFNWYKNLWKGINKLDNDYEDMTKSDEEKTEIDPSDYDKPENWIRKPAKDLYPPDGKWTIGDALKDLFDNFAAYDPLVNDEKGFAAAGCTTTNSTEYARDYEEDNGYSGMGLPIMLDPDLFEVNAERNIPDHMDGSAAHRIFNPPHTYARWEDINIEHYGYMDALDMPFVQDPKIMAQESLSMGKFLEDIGMLAGRYPVIRTDILANEGYIEYTPGVDPEDPYKNRYNNYERCILTFKPLPSDANDDQLKNIPESTITNNDIEKGFQHDYYEVDDIEIIKIPLNDGTNVEYKRLDKAQRKDNKQGLLQTYTMPNNLFASYLVTKSDDEEIKAKLDLYKSIREEIFGTETKYHNMSTDALFYQGFLNMKHVTYTPYQMKTYCDPCRECGDRIMVDYLDVITGERSQFFTYILERSIEGIQKMMDTYTAKGDMNSPVFSNYQTGTKYQSGASYGTQSIGYDGTGGSGDGSYGSTTNGISAADLVQYWRNVGIRLLDEPTDCSAKYIQGNTKSSESENNESNESS